MGVGQSASFTRSVNEGSGRGQRVGEGGGFQLSAFRRQQRGELSAVSRGARGASPGNRSVFRAASPEGAAATEANHTVAPPGLTYRLPFKPGADAPGY